MEAEIQRARAVNSIKAREKYEHSLDTFWQIFKQMSAEIQNGAEAMNTRTHPDEATPLTHDLGEPLIHEEREPPVSLRKPSVDYITLLVATDAGVPMAIAREWLDEMGLSSPPAGWQGGQS